MKSIACVIPVRNDGDRLRRALMSVCTQQSPPDEVLVLDDFSDDDTPEVCERYAANYPFVRFVRYPRKADDWRSAACVNALNLTSCDYIHTLSANDYVDAHYYAAVRAVRDEGFIFAEYTILKPDGLPLGQAFCEMLPGQHEYPRHLLLNQLSNGKFFEGGPVALVRRDAWKWLCDREFWRMNTWQDSIGYSVGAWLYGAAYVPFPCGYFTYDENGDGEARKRNALTLMPMYRAVEKFLEGVKYQIPDKLRYALLGKVYTCVPRQFRLIEMQGMDLALAEPEKPFTPTQVAVEVIGFDRVSTEAALPTLATEAASNCASSGDLP